MAATVSLKTHASSQEWVITNAKLVLADEVISGSLALKDGAITAIDHGPSRSAGALDLAGDWLIPGLIDLHTDNLEKHFQPRPGVTWDGVLAAIAHDAQVAGVGITTVFDSLTVGAASGWDTRADMLAPMIDGLREARRDGLLRVDHLLHLRAETTHPEITDLLAPYWQDALVRLISLMDHTPGQRQQPDLDQFRRFYRDKIGKSEAWIDQHIEEMQIKQAQYSPPNRQALSDCARINAIPLASHDDATLAHVEDAQRLGVHVSEFPTTVTAAQAARARGMHVLMGAPNLIRGGSHSGNVAAGGLAECGFLDVLASDYIPASLLQGAFRLTQEPYNWSLPRAIACVTAAPADAANLTDRGTIAAKRRADLVHVQVINDRPVVRGVWSAGVRVA